MWYVILAVVVMFAVWLWLSWGEDAADKLMSAFVVGVCGVVILGILGYPVLRFTTGFYADYSTGQREGYVTKVSEKGLIFKTNEGQLQVGTGQMAALQAPWAFSIPDQFVPQVQAALGKRVVIEYSQFLLMPFRYGETDFLVTKVTVVSE